MSGILNSPPPVPCRYYATHSNHELNLHGWDDRRIAEHRQKDFSTGHYVHIVDRTTDHCVACGKDLLSIYATPDKTCAGANQHLIAQGFAPVSRKTVKGPDDCHTEEKPKSDKLIAESAQPTTGIDWDAFKNFGKGL